VRYLLDTHTFLWWILDDPRLSSRAGAIIRDPGNEMLMEEMALLTADQTIARYGVQVVW